MKNKLIAALAALTCGVFIASPICAGAALPELAILLAETAFSDFIGRSAETDEDGNRKGFVGALRDYQNMLPEGCLFNPIIANDDISFRVPNYYLVTGKCHFMGDFSFYNSNHEVVSTVPVDQLVECTFLCMDDEYTSSDYNKNTALTKESDGGKYLFGNALNLRIVDNLGNETNLVMSCTDNLYNKVHVLNDRVSIDSARYDVYVYSGMTLTQEIYTNHYNYGVRFNNMTTNSIDIDVQTLGTRPTGSIYWGQDSSGFLPYGTSQGSPRDSLSILDIVENRVYTAYYQDNSNSWRCTPAYPLLSLQSGFVVTNNNTAENTIVNNWTTLSTQNYYIDNIFEGDTIIDKTNYNDWGGGALAPVFTLPDVDLPSLPLADILDILTDLLPDVTARLQPSIDIGLDSLFDRLLDFYGNMPDIGLQWDPDLDNNNYFDVDLPSPPDSGGIGDITVNVDITRPKIPYIDTNPQITLYVPTVTTTALPPSVISSGKEFVDWGKEVTDMTGTTSIIITCGLVGVGVMLIFKDW